MEKHVEALKAMKKHGKRAWKAMKHGMRSMRSMRCEGSREDEELPADEDGMSQASRLLNQGNAGANRSTGR